MSKSDREEIRPIYASGYRVTITESNTSENTDNHDQTMLYPEIDKKEKNGNNPEYPQNALDDRIPADFITDNNGDSEA